MTNLIDLIHSEWRKIDNDSMLAAYVPYAETMDRGDAIDLAEQCDREAAYQLKMDCQSLLHINRAVLTAHDNPLTEDQKIALQNLGFDPSTY